MATAMSVGEAEKEKSVDMSQLFFGSRFAHGAHSNIYHGLYKGVAVAVKVTSAPPESGNLATTLKNQYDREVTLLSRLHHPNVITFVGACNRPPVYYVVTEYLSQGSLRAYLHKLQKDQKLSLPLPKRIAIALDIARGMEYIHSQRVIHRDLKPENLLIDQHFRIKIADFGVACEEGFCGSVSGTYRWMAPEMLRNKSYGKKVDVYSFGLILWELVAGRLPFEDLNPLQVAFAVVHKNSRPVIPPDCPPAIAALIQQCWSLDPKNRPDFSHIVKVLEQFQSSLSGDQTLNLVQNSITCQHHQKRLLHWFRKLFLCITHL